MSDSPNPMPRTHARFQDTHWSVVLAAGVDSSPQAQQALEILCRAYWGPLYTYVRRCGESPEDAEDLTQAFFARVLEKNYLRAAAPERGRFRWFLLASLKHFLANEWDRARAAKRGGGRRGLSLDQLSPNQLNALESADCLSPEKAYDRSWALVLLEQARTRLRAEFDSAGRLERFELLEQFLPGADAVSSYAEIARRLGMAEGTIKSDVSRLRRRYGEMVREEVALTLGRQMDLDDELRHLFQALG